MEDRPSRNGANGRDAQGRFLAGNAGGPGNPHAKRTAELRAILLDVVTDDDYRAVVARLLKMAKAGNLAAIREILDRTVGKPVIPIAAEVWEETPDTVLLTLLHRVQNNMKVIDAKAIAEKVESEKLKHQKAMS